ncbi:MAG: hypothetical protein Q4G13_02005 [Moraxella sp.]|nr:hypothetical protein [Moraxella sp.]
MKKFILGAVILSLMLLTAKIIKETIYLNKVGTKIVVTDDSSVINKSVKTFVETDDDKHINVGNINTNAGERLDDKIDIDKNDFAELRKLSDNGVLIVPLKDITDNNHKKIQEKRVDNLIKYGSMSGGKLPHEFANIAQKRTTQNKPLAFTATNTEYFVQQLNSELELTGRLYTGVVDGNGYNSVFHLYENSDNSKKLEINEMYLNEKNNTVVEITEELLNHKINNLPVTFETISDNKNTYYNAQFAVKNRYFSVSSENINRSDLENFIGEIILDNQR